MATRIQTDTRQSHDDRWTLTITVVLISHPDLIQQGISEKVALSASFLGAFATGFIREHMLHLGAL